MADTQVTSSDANNSGLYQTFKPRIDQLDQELSKFSFLRQLEKKSGVKKTVIVFVSFSAVLIFLVMNWAANFLSIVIGFIYPAYSSILAIETPDKSDDKQWLTYWVVFSFFSFLEFFADHLLFILPFYYLIKVLFLVYLFSPYTKGAEVLYLNLIRPFFFAAQNETNRLVSEANKRGWKSDMDQVKQLLEDEVKKAM